MNYYNQHDYRDRLGTCDRTISTDGCFITSLASFAGLTPPEVNKLLTEQGGYSNGCMVSSAKAAVILGLPYKGIVYEYPRVICIAETDYYASKGYSQHFFILLENGEIADPLIGYPTANHYEGHIKSYRLFEPKGELMSGDDLYYILNPVWRRLNNNAVPNEASLRAECNEIAATYKNWSMDALIQRWIEESSEPCDCTEQLKTQAQAFQTQHQKEDEILLEIKNAIAKL